MAPHTPELEIILHAIFSGGMHAFHDLQMSQQTLAFTGVEFHSDTHEDYEGVDPLVKAEVRGVFYLLKKPISN